MPAAGPPTPVQAIAEAVASVPLWYHTLELAPGLVTPGWFDLRPVVDRLPWPEVEGLRCLDVGTYDGFLAYELERRGAAEVVALDIGDHESWDWPALLRARGPEALAAMAGSEKGRGFAVAHSALGSRVQRAEGTVYDLDPSRDGRFDVVVCGSLMLHLRDPIRALEAIRSVCSSWFLSIESIELGATLLHPRRPVVRLDGLSELCQWWLPNLAGHRRMVESAGFALQRTTKPFTLPFGPGHRAKGTASLAARVTSRAFTGGADGIPEAAVLARPTAV